jgi:lipopolysaccharide assembly outer membrane protein LptD (OstA)
MRRKAKRAFRYIFPGAVLVGCTLLFIQHTPTSQQKTCHDEVTTEKKALPLDTSAKMLRLFSHNPDTQEKVMINSKEAVENGDKLILLTPIGVLENPKGHSLLKSTTASYDKTAKQVDFIDNVSFDSNSGLVATTDYATLDAQTQKVSGNKGIKAIHQQNTIQAESYVITPTNDVINFTGKVCLSFDQRKTKH